MAPLVTQRPLPTSQQQSSARRRRGDLEHEVARERANYSATIDRLAQRYGKTRTYISMQLYGGKINKPRKVNAYNAMMHARSEDRKAAGIPSDGRQTLPNLAREVAAEDWNQYTEEERKEMLARLEETRQEREAAKLIPMKSAAIDISNVGNRRLQPELEALHQRTGAEYLVFLLHGQPQDNWPMQVYTSEKAALACAQVLKKSPNEIALRMEGCIIGGIQGALKESGEKRFNMLKKSVRGLITTAFKEALAKKGYKKDQIPKDMMWSDYVGLQTKFGIHLVGWPEDLGHIRNPGEFRGCAPLERLLAGLDGPEPELHWEELDKEDWSKLKTDAQQKRQEGNPKRPGRSATKRRSVKKRQQAPISAEYIESSDDENPPPSETATVTSPPPLAEQQLGTTSSINPPDTTTSNVMPLTASDQSASMPPAALHVTDTLSGGMSDDAASRSLSDSMSSVAPSAVVQLSTAEAIEPSLLSSRNVSLPSFSELLGASEHTENHMTPPTQVSLGFPSMTGMFASGGYPMVDLNMGLPDMSQYNPAAFGWQDPAGMDIDTLDAIANGRVQ